MCEAATLAVVSAGVQIASSVAQHGAQADAYRDNAKAATANLLRSYAALNTRQTEEQKAASRDVQAVGQEVAKATGTAVTSAGEAGVSGLSVDLLVKDYARQQATATDQITQNYEITSDAIQSEKESARLGAKSQINSVAYPSLLPTALQIGGAGLDLAGKIRSRKAPASTGGQ